MISLKRQLPPHLLPENALQVKVVSIGRLIWRGEATSVSSVNSKGQFDILGQHRNFLTIVEKVPIIVRSREADKKFEFPRSIIYVLQNKVSIFVDL